jgi:hypothetical protein
MKKLVLFFIVILSYSNSIACMCTGSSEHSSGELNLEWWNESEYVFTATIDSTITIDEWSQASQELFFKVTKRFKGKVEDNISFYSPMFGSSCEWDLRNKVGKEFIIFGYIDDKGILVSHFCQGSSQILNQNEIDSLYDKDYKIAKTIRKQNIKFIEDISMFQNGLVKTFYSNGNLTAKGNFENYQPIGYWKYYAFEGEITSEGRYKNYKKNGVWIENVYKHESSINSDNEIEYEFIFKGFKKGEYSNGEKNGVWKSYDANGKFIKTE